MVRRERRRPEHAGRQARHLTAFVVFTVLVYMALGMLFFMHDFIPRPASVERQSIDSLLKILFGIGGVIFGLIISLFVYSIVFFRVRRGQDPVYQAIRVT
jgi:heme/copper-type cytochrome/quinol oxidase subunit 2